MTNQNSNISLRKGMHRFSGKEFLLLLLCLVLGCFYNFSGFTRRNIKSIAIPVFENQTIKYGIEETLTKLVIDAFIQDNRLEVLDREDAESILLGEITGYNREPFSYDERAQIKDYKVEIAVKLVYKDKKDQTLWQKELKEYYLYPYEESEEAGIDSLCGELANDILKGVLEEW